jgi:uncharacterized protein YbaR (Trm112 family)
VFIMPKLSPELLSVLRCPVTGSALAQDGDELVTVTADDSGNKLRYRIEDGIPLLLPPELLPAATAARSDQHDGGENDTAPNDTAPNDTAPNDTAPTDTAPNDASPRHAAE